MFVGLALLSALCLAACDSESPSSDGGPADEDTGTGMCRPSCEGVACGAPDACGGTCTCDVVTTEHAIATGAQGEVSVTVSVPEGGRSFLVSATTRTDATLAVVGIEDPSGERIVRWQDWYDGDEALTNAFFASDPATVINWPVRAADPPLVAGDYVVRLGSYQRDGVTERGDIDLDVTAMVSSDAVLDAGVVRVVVVYADGLEDDADLVEATQRAVAHWETIWAEVGLSVELRYAASTLDPALPYPDGSAADFMLEASSFANDGEVVVVLGETVSGSAGTYGISGQIPGPLVPSVFSAVVIGWLANAGGDGAFSEDDIMIYGEVFAHEVGHYLGLFHPVSNSYDSWDALGDTARCSAAEACESMLGQNLMFPYSICDGGSCLRAMQITDGQAGVMHRYVGTR